jgi:hypothetical protein
MTPLTALRRTPALPYLPRPFSATSPARHSLSPSRYSGNSRHSLSMESESRGKSTNRSSVADADEVGIGGQQTRDSSAIPSGRPD